jgi:hypothetical protein
MKHILIALALSLNTFASVTPEQFADKLVFQSSPANAACIQHLKLSIKKDWEEAGGGSVLIAIVKSVDESEALEFKAVKFTHERVSLILYLHLDSFLTAINARPLPVPPGELIMNYSYNEYIRLFEKNVGEPTKADALELWQTFLQGKISTFYESGISFARKEYEDYLNILIRGIRSEFYMEAIKKTMNQLIYL